MAQTCLPRWRCSICADLCQRNELADGGFELMGHTLKLSDIDVPLCAIACETDHIAPWKDCYRGVQQMGSKDKTFIMTQSGHIAGIVNPPSKNKYGHYTNDDLRLDLEDVGRECRCSPKGRGGRGGKRWLRKRVRQEGNGREVRVILTIRRCAPAPGTYVRLKASD